MSAVRWIVFLAVAAGLAFVAAQVVETWDDWVIVAVGGLGPLGLALAIHRREYPSRSLKRRFGRSSGPDAPTARVPTTGRSR